MLKNLWYVAAQAADVPADRPKHARVLGQDLVIFRKGDGFACLHNVCVHRGGNLARGELHGGQVMCPYHGWQFNAEGRCTLIPSLGPDARIPKRARVDAYPAEERYGFVWVFLGDLPADRRPPLPDIFPEYYDTENWRCISGAFHYRANWQRVTENGLDSAHTHFVHPAFGNREDPRVEDADIEHLPWGARTGHFYKAKEKKGGLGEVLDKDRGGRKGASTDLQFHMCGLTVKLKQIMSPVVSQIIFSCKTPIDEENTLTFYVQARNYLMDSDQDEERRKGLLEVFQQDADIVEYIAPPKVPAGLADELSVSTDKMPMAFRIFCKRLAKKGWELDPHAIPEVAQGKELRVVPCPARRDDPAGWTFKPMPTTLPENDAEDLDVERESEAAMAS